MNYGPDDSRVTLNAKEWPLLEDILPFNHETTHFNHPSGVTKAEIKRFQGQGVLKIKLRVT